MSAIARFQTQLRDSALIAAACKELGLTCEVREQNKQYSHQPDISIQHNSAVGLYVPISLNKQADGTYMASMDGDFGNSWIGRISQEYKIAQRMQAAEEQGLVFMGRHVDQTPTGPRVQLQYTTR